LSLRLCEELFLSHQAQERDDNLLFVSERMLRSEVDQAGLLSLYARVYEGKRIRNDLTDPLIGILRLSGIARARGGYLSVGNRVYERVFDRRWVKTNLPEAELRRQRLAYRRGLARATAIAALILILLAFTPEGKRLTSVSRDGVVKAWEAATEQEILAQSR
jgi:hypothetical protein